MSILKKKLYQIKAFNKGRSPFNGRLRLMVISHTPTKCINSQISFSIQFCRSLILVKVRNSKKKCTFVLIIVNINKDENKSLISNQSSLRKMYLKFLTFTRIL